jgi:cobalamin synthase
LRQKLNRASTGAFEKINRQLYRLALAEQVGLTVHSTANRNQHQHRTRQPMTGRGLWQQLIHTGTGLSANAVPLIGFLWGGWAAETAMILYWLETILSAPLVVLLLYWLTPTDEREDPPRWRKRRELIQGYLLLVGSFSLGCGIFMSIFLFLFMKLPLDLATLRTGLLPIAAFLLLGFVADLFLLQPTPLDEADNLIRRSVSRVMLLYLAVFVGVVLAAFNNRGFLWPFVILKTLADVEGLFLLAVRPRPAAVRLLESVKVSYKRSHKP